MTKKFVITIFITLLFLTFSYTQENKVKLNLEDVKNKLIEEEQELKVIKNSRISLIKETSLLEDKILFLESSIGNADLEYKNLQKKIRHMNEERSALSKKIKTLHNDIMENNIYLIDNAHMLKVKALLFTHNYHYLLKNLDLIEYINNNFNNIVLEYKIMMDKFESINNSLQDKIEKLASIKQARAYLLKNYKDDRLRYNHTIAILKEDESLKASYLQLLKEKQINLEKEVAKLKNSYDIKESDIEKVKGALPWPVIGHLLSNTTTDKSTFNNIYSKGIRIVPISDGSVKAVFNGIVEYVNWIRGYGSIIIINHGKNYYTIYANIDKILVKENEKINIGKDIGIINLDRTTVDSYIYFEIRKGDQALNPLDWLKKEA
jgi:murein DD-endopeptidase MepM/ murein hydrolase activator NlpD